MRVTTRGSQQEQQRVWRAFIRMSGQLWDCVERDLQTAAGMPHGYYLILAMLSEAPDRSLRMNQLAQVVWSSQSRVSHAVARLEETGWVRRGPSPGDRRGQIATLTDAGWPGSWRSRRATPRRCGRSCSTR